MTQNRSILIVGNPYKVTEYAELLSQEGVLVTIEENFNKALLIAKEMMPGAIVTILPVYMNNVTDFVDKIREIDGLTETPIVHIGNIIESADQEILQRHGVKTLALGPVPIHEMVRFILKALPS